MSTPTLKMASTPLPYPTLDQKRRKLRVAIITENFLPKVDGVTRTLARLLEHLNEEGHEAIVFGPDTGIKQYAGHPVVGTFGLPLVLYPGLKLNFMRPRFIRRLQQFKPDVIHFVDPIWLGAQMMHAVQKWLPLIPCVSSYHTNLPTYAVLFGVSWLESTMWKLSRSLHDRCDMVFCPSESTRRMLCSKGFSNVEIWSRGVDTSIFTPNARDDNLRASWGCMPRPLDLPLNLTPAEAQEIALMTIANKLGVQIPRTKSFTKRGSITPSTSSSPDDNSFIRTPQTGPSLTASPQLSPPPAYDTLAGIPDLPSVGFALPPPMMSAPSLTRIAQESDSAESKTVILYVGRISWEKNIRLLIEAFRMLPAKVRVNAKLVFVGDGPARGDLTRLCKKYNLEATFMGHQKGKRLAAMYASSSVFAFPSFTETFGQVVLEALASGLPVVGMHAEGTSDLVVQGKTGLLMDVNNPTSSPSSSDALDKSSHATTCGLKTPIPSINDFAASMSPNSAAFQDCAKSYSSLLEKLISDRSLRMAMGQRAQLMAAHRTWWDAMDAVVRGYETVVAARGVSNLSNEELEALRTKQQKIAPLTGPIVKLFIALYLVGVIALWMRFFSL